MWRLLCVVGAAAMACAGAAGTGNEYLVLNEYQYVGDCGGKAQRQSGTRFGACVVDAQSAQSRVYAVVKWDETTSVLDYSVTTYPSLDCSGAGTTEALSVDGTACTADADGGSSSSTYLKGRTPWVQQLVGGVVDLVYFNQDGGAGCQGLPAQYVASSYDGCAAQGDGTSTGVAGCSSASYQTYQFSDGACSEVSAVLTTSKAACAYDAAALSWHTAYCGLSSENYLETSISDDDKASALPVAALALSLVAMALSTVAVGAWVYSQYGPKKAAGIAARPSAVRAVYEPLLQA